MGGVDGLDFLMKPARNPWLKLTLISAALMVAVPALADTQSSTPASKATPAATSSKSASAKPAVKKAKHSSESTKSAKAAVPADGCKPTPDQASIGIRALQTELMVAGLKCSAEQWNTFTAKFKTTIKSDADRLQRVFLKAYGKGGANQMNAFVTQLANDASQRSNGFAEVDYCKQEDVLYKKVLSLTGQELERFSAGRALAVAAPVALCKPDPVDTPPAATVAATTTPPPAAGDVSLKR